MKKLIILLIVLCFFAIEARADDLYFYGVVKAKLIKVANLDGEQIIPDIPFDLYSYYAVSGGADLTYSKDLKNEGKEIMACVAVQIKDKEALKHWGGYIGESFDEVKITADYTKHYSYKIKDIRRTYDEKTGEPIEYLGADKNDPARFCQWCDVKKAIKQ